MKIVSIKKEFRDICAKCDKEFMYKQNRPCVLILRLNFRGKRTDFAVPFRSNISPTTPKNQYYALSPRPTTKPKHRHGIHYIKMFPVKKENLQRFRTEGNEYYTTIKCILDSNTSIIVKQCQD